jgi:hypothetical protein
MNIQKSEEKTLKPVEMGAEIVKLTVLKKRIDDRLKVLRDQLLEETRRLDVLTLKTGDYIVMRVKKKSIKVINKNLLEEELKGWDIEVVKTIDLEVMKPAINRLILEGNELKGVEVNDLEYLSIRVNPEKKGKDEKEISGRDKGERLSE